MKLKATEESGCKARNRGWEMENKLQMCDIQKKIV